MPKNAKIRKKKVRNYKVYRGVDYSTPCIRMGGKFLTKELGINIGDRLEMTSLDDDTIVLRKLSSSEVAEFEANQQRKALFKQLKALLPNKEPSALTMMVAESRVPYTVDDELAKYPEKYSQA